MTSARQDEHHVTARLSTLDRLLPVWIGAAMGLGLLLGRLVPGLGNAISAVQFDGVSLPIAIGLLVMMYPVLAKVRYDRLDTVTRDRKLLLAALFLVWVVGPALMFTLAWLFLGDLPEYRTGIIIVGLAPCIAMVIIWNDLARGDREAAAVLVAINSVIQVLIFAVLGWFYLSVLPGWLGMNQTAIATSTWQIAKSVLIFLGIPLVAGYLTRRYGERPGAEHGTSRRFLPRIGPWALYGLLFTIVILFALQGANRSPPATGRGADSATVAGLFRHHVDQWLPRRWRAEAGLSAHHHPRVHLGRQQLRTRHRGGDRHLRGDIRSGAGRRGRTADRSAGPRRPGVRVAGLRRFFR